MTTATPSSRRFRPGLKTVANGAATLVLILAVAAVPLSALAHQSMLSSAGQVVIFLPIAAVGLVVARRLPHNPIGWLLLACAAGVLLFSVAASYAWLVYRLGHRLPLGPLALVLAMSWLALFLTLPLVILLFPDGTLPSRRWYTVLWAYVAVTLCLVVSVYAAVGIILASGHFRFDASSFTGVTSPSVNTAWLSAVIVIVIPVLAAFWLAFIGRLALGWRHASGERRQQLKWLLSGAAAGIATGLISIFIGLFDPHAPAAVQVITSFLNDAGFVVFAVCIGVAILKYRLYDIDRIISRTLAYAIVTGLLIGVYIGLIALTTRVLPFTSAVGVALSTLAAAAIFNPVRHRVQQMVDRRFNRAHYDADQAVAAFAAQLRDAVDLDSVRDDLAQAVHQALEPAHVSVWISQHR